MKKKALFRLGIFGSICFTEVAGLAVLTEKESKCLAADSSSSEIGLWAETEPVLSKTKVYIPPSTVSQYRRIGRDVFAEESGDNIHYFSLELNQSFVSYYYATPLMGKVTNIRTISNDVSSLIFIVEQLEKKAVSFISSYSGSEETIDVANLVLGYGRSIKKSDTYHLIANSINAWDITSGTINRAFINFVESDTTHGLLFQDYFASFLDYAEYNENDHAAPQSQYQKDKSSSAAIYQLIDPISGGQIDLTHLFASLDAAKQITGANESICSNLQMSREFSKGLCSWIGDLQCAARDLTFDSIYGPNSFNVDTATFNQLMESDAYECTDEDVFADIDAINIAKGYLDLGNSVSSAFRSYYEQSMRFSRFLAAYSNISLFPSYDFGQKTTFEINALFAVDTKPIMNGDDSISYNIWISEPISFEAMFKLLMLVFTKDNGDKFTNGTCASLAACEFVANSFCDFVESQALLEE